MYAGGYLCRFAFQPPWSVFNSRQTLFHCCISFPSISLNLHLAKYYVSQIRHPFKAATLKDFQLEPLPSLLPLIRGGFHVMFLSQRSLTALVQAWTLAARFFHVSVQRRTIITGIRLPKMPRDFRIVIQSVIKHALCSDVKFSFIILLSFACIM